MRRFACVVLLSAALAAPAMADSQPEAIEPAVPILPISEIRPGMKAVGRTVYEGSEIETFEAEILGVLPGAWGPGEDVILARLLGPKADRYGVAAGMSGSPMYVDGKLIGALSLAYGGFMREPIAGITPIESMLRVPRQTRADASEGGASPIQHARARTAGQLVPVLTPVVLSGFDPAAIPIVESMFEPYGFTAVAGGSKAGRKLDVKRPENLEPGSAVCGVLMQGDLNMQGTGTLTYADDSVLLAFGHAFLLYGDVEMPLATGKVVTTIPSDNLSFKIAYPDQVIGALTRDNRTGVAGRIGQSAHMLPVQLDVERDGTRRQYHFEIFRNRVFSSMVLGAGVVNALVATPDYSAEGTMVVQGRVFIDGYPDLRLKQLYFDLGPQGSTIPLITQELSEELNVIFNNPVAPAKVERVELSFVEVPGKQLVRIEGAWPERTQVTPGEDLEVSVRVRPHQGEVRVEKARVHVPEGVTPGSKLQVTVASAGTLESRRPVVPASAEANDLEQIIRNLNQRRTDDAVYVQLTRPAGGVMLRGVELEALPPSVLSVVKDAAPYEASLTTAALDEKRVPLNARVTGEVTFDLTVR